MIRYNRELFINNLKAWKNVPPVYTEIEDIKFEREYKIPEEFQQYIKSPIHILPELIAPDEVFILITHSELMPNIVPNRYYISNYGRIFDVFRNRIVIDSDNGRGYRSVTLTFKINNTTTKLKTVYVHRLVCFYFNYFPGCYPKYEVNHIDAIKNHNFQTNLEWVDSSENKKYRTGGNLFNSHINRGENQHDASMTEEQVRKLCNLINSGITNYKQLAHMVECSESAVRHIKAKDTWTWITKDYYIPDFCERSLKGLTPDKAEKICQLLSVNTSSIEIQQSLDVTSEQLIAIKYNGIYPEIRRKYGL